MKKILNFDYTAASAPIIAIYLSLSFVFSDFGISAVFGAFLLCLWTGICLLHFIFVKKGNMGKPQTAHWLILAFNVLVFINILRNFSFDRTVIYYAIILAAGSVLFWISSPASPKALKIARYSVIAVALFFSAVNLLYAYFPQQVRSVAFEVMTKTSITYNNRMAYEGYGFAFGEEIGFTAHLTSFALALVWFDVTEKNLKSHLPMLLLLAFGLISIQRRGELLVCVMAIIIVTTVKFVKNKKLSNKGNGIIALKTIATPALCIVLSFVVFSTTTAGSRFDYRQYLSSNLSEMDENEDDERLNIYKSEIDIDKFGNGRIVLWNLALEGFAEKPIFGHGWRAFKDIAPSSGNIHATNAHNIYLQLLCETGIVGFAALGTVFVWFLILIIKKIIKTKDTEECKYYFLGLYILLAMLGQGLIDNSIYLSYWIQTFQLMLFFVFLRKEQTEITDSVKLKRRNRSKNYRKASLFRKP